MFDDENSNSFWHPINRWNFVKTLTFKFFDPINFQYLRILRRRDAGAVNALLDVCLVLHGDTTDELCTDQAKGFSNSDDESVQWTLPSNFVTEVKLVFRYIGTDSSGWNSHAMIRDLKIFYRGYIK